MIRAKRVSFIVIINLCVLLVLLGIVEIVLRVMGKGYSNSPVDSDPVLNWVHPHNYLFRCYGPTGEFGNFMVYFDSLGRRSQLPNKLSARKKDSPVIAFLGDSFVEALQVPYDSSFVGILSARFPNITFLNYGVTGYAPVLYYLQCKQLLKEQRIKPTAVVMVLYSNDIREDSSFLGRAVYDEKKEIVAINGGRKNSLAAIIRRSYLVRMCRKTYIQWEYSKKKKDLTDLNGVIVNNLLEENNGLDNTLSAEYILKTDSLLRIHGISFYLTAIPSRYTNFTKDTSITSFAHRAERWAREKNIPFINMRPIFDSLTFSNPGKLFYAVDVHCNANGQAAIAKALEPIATDLK